MNSIFYEFHESDWHPQNDYFFEAVREFIFLTKYKHLLVK